MNNRQARKSCRILILTLAALPALCQIAQERPELCGKPDGRVPLPSKISASPAGSHTVLTIGLDNRDVNVELSGVQSVDEVCPLEGNRLLVFATEGAGDATIFIVSQTTGTVLDSFLIQTPAVSPDQHWLSMRDWIIPSSRIPVTEQYLLYDLTKDAAANRRYPGVSPGTALRYGRTMYPVTHDQVPFENHGVRADQVHSFAGGSFYWSADSRYVVFTDRAPDGLKLVLVKTGGDDLTTLVHALSDTDICGTLSGASVTVPRYGVLEVQATFRAAGSVACTKVLTLHDEDFQAAKEETYPPRQTRPSVQIK